VPVYWPLQVQLQEPGLVTAEAVPAEQRLAEGAVENQAPFTAAVVPVVKVVSTPYWAS